MRIRLRAALVAAAFALVVPASAQAVGELAQLGAPFGCLTPGGSGSPCGPLAASPMARLLAIAASPDGKHVYVADDSDNSVLIFARDASTGRLTEAGCVGSGTGCVVATPLTAPDGIAISPNGKYVYVTGAQSNSLLVFQRDAGTGGLSLLQCLVNLPTATCVNARALSQPFGVAASPDGTFVYVASYSSDAVAVFAVDPTTGELSQPVNMDGCVSLTGAPGCTQHGALDGPYQVEAASDRVYVTSLVAHSLVAFGRSPTGLTQLPAPDGCAATVAIAGCAVVPLGDSPAGIALTPDGSHVFVAAQGANDDRVVSFDRTSGGIAAHPGPTGCVANGAVSGCGAGRALDDPWDLALTGGQLYVASRVSGSLTVLDATADGALSPRSGPFDCWVATGPSSGCTLGSGLANVAAVAASADGHHLYTAAGSGDVGAFRRNTGASPSCADVSVSTAYDTPVAVPLSCSDPDGDAVTLSIVSTPGGGTLGPIDQASARVAFTPTAGFSGDTAFTYRGASLGSDSTPATAKITVGAPLPPARPRVIATTISSSWTAGRRFTRNKTLVLKHVPAGARVRTTCKGKGCPFKSRSQAVKKATKQLTLTGLFKKRRLRPKTVVEVRVTLAGSTGKLFRFTIRKSKQPGRKTLCLPPGSTKPKGCS